MTQRRHAGRPQRVIQLNGVMATEIDVFSGPLGIQSRAAEPRGGEIEHEKYALTGSIRRLGHRKID
jgi:hypothetical protein